MILSLVLTVLRVDDTLDMVEVKLTIALCLSCDHVLFEFLGLRLLPAMEEHVGHDWALEIVVQLSPAFVRGRGLVVLPCGVIVSLALPFDLLRLC